MSESIESQYQDMLAGVDPQDAVVKKSNHQANIVRIDEVLPHPDPETTNLEIIHLNGYQVVVGKGQFKAGDLGVYIQPDSVVPQTETFQFIWEPHLYTLETPGLACTPLSEQPLVPEKRRRITVRKFRGQWSEGLLLPLSDFPTLAGGDNDQHVAGDDVSDYLGITHYDPDTGTESTKAAPAHAPKKKFRLPRSFKGWMKFLWHFIFSPKAATRDVPFVLPTYDVEAYKNYKGTFQPDEYVVVTEKIHGSNARYICLDDEIYVGSRNEWKATGGDDVWNKALKLNPNIGTWLRANPGYALYGEITPTQKVKGKTFDYGSSNAQFFVFDILSPGKTWLSYTDAEMMLIGKGLQEVPVLYVGRYNSDKIDVLVDGDSIVPGAKHIREGVVIKTFKERRHRGLGRAQLKLVSNAFLKKDSE